MKALRHSSVAASLAALLLATHAEAARAAEPSPAADAPTVGPPDSAPASTASSTRREDPPARGARVKLPLEVEVHGRFYMGVGADEREGWARELDMRSARITLEARLPRVLTVVEADVAEEAIIEDAFVRLDAPYRLRLTAGRFKAPFSERRLASSWRLPLVGRGLVDEIVVRDEGLGGRRLGATAAFRPYGGRVELAAGAFVGDKDALGGDEARAEDVAARVSVRPSPSLEVGATAYRRGATADAAAGPRREAATAFLNVEVGPLEAMLEAFAGTLQLGSFTAATALVGWTLPLADAGKLRLTPIAGGERLELSGPAGGVADAVLAGAVLGWADGLKVKLQAERARRPGEDARATAVALEIATRF